MHVFFLPPFFLSRVDEKVTSIEATTAKVQANSIQTNIELLLATPNQYHFRIDICRMRNSTHTTHTLQVTWFTNGFRKMESLFYTTFYRILISVQCKHVDLQTINKDIICSMFFLCVLPFKFVVCVCVWYTHPTFVLGLKFASLIYVSKNNYRTRAAFGCVCQCKSQALIDLNCPNMTFFKFMRSFYQCVIKCA